MTTFYLSLGVYILGAVFGIFVLTPWLKVNRKIDKVDTDAGIMISMFWPIALPVWAASYVVYLIAIKPAMKLYNLSEMYFQIKKAVKDAKPKKPEPPVDETKSTYRDIKLATEVGKLTLKHKWENFLKDREEKKKAKEQDKSK